MNDKDNLVKHWIIAAHERAVNEAGSEGLSLKESRVIVAQEWVKAVKGLKIRRPEEDEEDVGERLHRQFIPGHRTERRNSFPDNLDFINETRHSHTFHGISGYHDPFFLVAYPLGTSDGRDKVLGLWTSDDLAGAARERIDNAEETTEAASKWKQKVDITRSHMKETGAKTLAILVVDFGTRKEDTDKSADE